MTFTKEDTNIVKGIAILAMIFHHCYPNSTSISISMLESPTFLQQLASSGKVCVALLTILSGYGLSESYKNRENKGIVSAVRFSLSHYFQLLSMYWIAFLTVIILMYMRGTDINMFYGDGILGVRNFMIDFLGLGMLFHTNILIGEWYLTAVIAFYFLFPLLLFLIKKIKWGILVITYLPWVYYIVANDFEMHTDWFAFYIFSFALGIYLSYADILVIIKNNARKKRTIVFSIIFLLVTAVLRQFLTLPADPFLSLAIIAIEIVLVSRIPVIKDFLGICGKQSANMWLLHPWIMSEFVVFEYRSYVDWFIIVFMTSFAISLTLNSFKQGIKYNDIVRKIRKKIG